MSDQSAAKPRPRLFGKVLWGVAALGVAAVVYIIGQASTNPDASRGMRAFAKGEMAALQTPKDPRPAPVTTIYDPDGQPVRLGDFRGEVVVLNLWATWCPPCVREMPVLHQAQIDRPGVNFVFLNQGEPADKVRAWLRARQLPMRNVLLDANRQAGAAFKQRALPTTLFFDAQGRLVGTRIGELSAATLDERLRGLTP